MKNGGLKENANKLNGIRSDVVSYFCNNEICPYDDCKKRWKNQLEYDEYGGEPTIVDLQSACSRLTQYIVDSLNHSFNPYTERRGK